MKNQPYANGQHDLRRGVDFTGVTVVFICHDGKGKILLHKRSKNCRDEHGRWDCGGGALEFGESFDEAVSREVQEEYGVKPKDLQFVAVRNLQRHLNDGTETHWVAVDYLVLVDPKKVKNNEPYKIDEIGWFRLDKLPKPLHSQLLKALEPVEALRVI